MVRVGVSGVEELKARLERLGRDAASELPLFAARALATLATEAFDDPGLRPSPWPPLAESTLRHVGTAGKGVKEARDKARAWRAKAAEIAKGGAGLTGKKLERALQRSAAALRKSKEWKGKAKAKAAKAVSGKKMLYESGTLFRSIVASGPRVVSDRDYAVFHQFGTRKMPARPFVPVRNDGTLVEKAARRIGTDLEAALVRMFRRG